MCYIYYNKKKLNYKKLFQTSILGFSLFLVVLNGIFVKIVNYFVENTSIKCKWISAQCRHNNGTKIAKGDFIFQRDFFPASNTNIRVLINAEKILKNYKVWMNVTVCT